MKSEKKEYQKPEVRRVELSLSEVVLGTGCFSVTGDPQNPNCYPLSAICRAP
ncbi:MAG: hypothetical protein ACUVWZ_12545 [Anaerolineae bacterium]